MKRRLWLPIVIIVLISIAFVWRVSEASVYQLWRWWKKRPWVEVRAETVEQDTDTKLVHKRGW